jgi:threonine/homoserine/homoserine lactone efflux protein
MTDEVLAFFRGMAIGFAMAAPVGPVGLLCIRRALADGRAAAFVAGLGAAVADTLYGAVVGFGLTYISGFLVSQQTALKLFGGAFLLLIGWRSWKAEPVLVPSPIRGPGLLRDFVATLLITLTNPGTVFGFMGVFAAIGTAEVSAAPAPLVAGVFVGSAAWWLLLSAAAGAVRSCFTPVWLKRLNQGSGMTIVLFGVVVWASLLFQ